MRPVQSPARLPTAALAAALTSVLALLGAAPAAAVTELRAESRVEPGLVGLHGLVRFTIEVEGPGYQQPRLRPRFELENLEVVGAPNQRHGISVGAESGWRYSWTWRLRPLAVGPAAVREVHLLVGEREVELPGGSVEVVRESLPGAAGRGERSPRGTLEEIVGRLRQGRAEEGDDRERPVFLRGVATPARPYVGQRVVYTLFLYTRVPVRAMEPESLPQFQGLWARPVEVSPADQERVEWRGELYTRAPILRKELYAMAPRRHRIEPARLRFVVEVVERDRLFFSPVRVPVQLVAESNPVDLEVRPLPPREGGDGGELGGAVGTLSLGAVLEPTEVPVGHGATVTVTATGDGHLEALSPPPLPAPPGVDVLGPQAASPTDPRDDETRSGRTWQYLVVPRRAGSWALPALEIPYFDPEAGRYRTARARLPELVAQAATETTAAAGDPPRPIRSAALPAPRPPAWRTVLPWAFAVPWVAALVLVLARRRSGGGSGSVEILRRRLEDALREDRPRRAAAAIERAWREHLAEALGVPDRIPAASWPDRLRARGASREACHELREILDDLHYLRFAPELSATSALAGDLVARSERLARELVRPVG